MNSFEYYNPTRIIFGVGSLKNIEAETKKLGNKAMVVSYIKLGVLEKTIAKIERLLVNQDVEVIKFYEVSPNPLVSQVEKGIEVARHHKIDLIIGIGGGSAMDAAKLIAAGYYYEHDIWEMIVSRLDVKVDIPPKKALPLIMIPTLPATSSEMNCGAVVTNDKTTEKSYIFNEVLYPKVSIIDPELTLSLPAYQTALGAADAISHALETYLNIDDKSPLQKRMAQGVISTLMEITPKVLADLNNLDNRSILQWTASVAWNGWVKTGAYHGSPMHQLGHVLSAYNNIPHGATLSIIMPAWMKYTYMSDLDRYVDLARNVMCVSEEGKDKERIAYEGIMVFEQFLKDINVPTRLDDVEIHSDSLEKFTDKVVQVSCREDGTLNSRLPIGREDILKIYILAQ